jgi:hypothetical protein
MPVSPPPAQQILDQRQSRYSCEQASETTGPEVADLITEAAALDPGANRRGYETGGPPRPTRREHRLEQLVRPQRGRELGFERACFTDKADRVGGLRPNLDSVAGPQYPLLFAPAKVEDSHDHEHPLALQRMYVQWSRGPAGENIEGHYG